MKRIIWAMSLCLLALTAQAQTEAEVDARTLASKACECERLALAGNQPSAQDKCEEALKKLIQKLDKKHKGKDSEFDYNMEFLSQLVACKVKIEEVDTTALKADMLPLLEKSCACLKLGSFSDEGKKACDEGKELSKAFEQKYRQLTRIDAVRTWALEFSKEKLKGCGN